MTGYSGTPLAKKLGMKPGTKAAVFGAPEGFVDLLDPIPEAASLTVRPRKDRTYDVLVAFVRSETELHRRFALAAAVLNADGGLWIAWPKQSSPLATDLGAGAVRSYGLAQGLVDNKVCSIDADWSGLRFVVRLENRPGRSP